MPACPKSRVKVCFVAHTARVALRRHILTILQECRKDLNPDIDLGIVGHQTSLECFDHALTMSHGKDVASHGWSPDAAVMSGIQKCTLTLEALAPQSSQESLLLLAARVARAPVLATGGRLELLFKAEGAGGT